MSRMLNRNDIGKVFARADIKSAKNEFLLLQSIGSGKTKVLSFITFILINSSIKSVGDTGYINGPWYKTVDSISEKVIREVKENYEVFVKKRLSEIIISREKEQYRQDKFKEIYKKPDSWYLIELKVIENTPSYSYALWMDEESSVYALEVYDIDKKLILNESFPWTHEPRFGMSYDDSLSIYGDNGLLNSMILKVKELKISG